ncbi:tetratricopeptide repeat protein [Bradyrhizobium sp. SSUT112]|uniref:tetratricopeptide repeat protein n=1 Tax=Bradyrhizobium sp. SSUT112 TaxID=3040604 RepID=UPI0024498620|nr:tetratricopeptide repeat protein [Bradyrhizobium sp. SSUT112]MDH2356550.1 tetratricopeptide repeat protein [Bradyrhizobium sp. SSUT112]
MHAEIIERVRRGQLLDGDIPAIIDALMRGDVLASADGAMAVAGGVSNSSLSTFVLNFGHDANVELPEPILERLSEAVRLSLPAVRHNLPPVESTFTGRDREEKEILSVLTGHRSAVLKGIGGAGKTALAAKVGHRLTLQFPDAQLLFDLGGRSNAPSSPRATMENVILRFYPGTQLPTEEKAVLELYRDLLRRKRVFLIFDNARDGSQVEVLLPPDPSAAIVTSREELFLSDAKRVTLDDLLLPDAMALVTKLLDGERSLSDSDLRRLAKDCCFCHPLSLRVAALYLKGHKGRGVSDYIASVVADRTRLKLGRRSYDDVLAVIGQSVEQLRTEDKALCARWRDLSVFPSGFDAAAAATIWSIEDSGTASDYLSQLEERGIIEVIGEDRYRMHDLLREVAERDWPKARSKAAAQQHAVHYLFVLNQASQLYAQDGSASTEGLTLFDQERTNIETGQRWASEQNRSMAAAKLEVLYADVGADVLSLRLHPRERIRWYESALRGALRLADLRGQGAAVGNLGLAHADVGETEKAIDYHKRALTLSRELGDRRTEAQDLSNLGIAISNLGRIREAISFYDQAAVIAREMGDHLAEGCASNNLGFAYARLREPRRAIEYFEKALVFSRGNRRSEGRVLGNLGIAYADLGDVSKAIKYHEQALAISREMDDQQAQSMDLDDLGNIYARLGETSKAIELHEKGLAISRAIDDRQTEARHLRGAVRNAVGIRLGEFSG